jgi:hypothetical protein
MTEEIVYLVLACLLGGSFFAAAKGQRMVLMVQGIIWDCLFILATAYPHLLMSDLIAGHAGTISARIILSFPLGVLTGIHAAILRIRLGWSTSVRGRAVLWASWNQFALSVGSMTAIVLDVVIRGLIH